MTRKDVAAVHRLLGEYLAQFHLAPVLNEEEVAHFLVPQENIIHTYVVEVSSDVSRPRSIMAKIRITIILVVIEITVIQTIIFQFEKN